MPLGASRLNFLAKTQEAAAPEQRTAVTVTARGDAQIDTAQYKFGGSSLLLDGTGDDLNTDFYWTGSETAYTFETWIRASSLPLTYNYIYGSYLGGATGRTTLAVKNDGSIFAFVGGTGGGNATSSTGLVSTGTWYHLAFVWDGSDVNVYLNGTSVLNFACTIPSQTTNPVTIGSRGDTTVTQPWTGHFDEIRISNTAVYTTGFTAPTAPFTNDNSTTELLVHADGTDGDTVFIDDNGDRAPIGISAITSTINTSSSKIGNSSVKLDTSGGRVQLNDLRTAIDLNSDWTIEFWFRSPTNSGFDQLVGQWGSGSVGYRTMFIGLNNNIQPTFYYTDSSNSTAAFTGTNGALASDTWHHYAVVATGSDIKIYINGSQDGSLGSRPTFTNDSTYEFTLFENFNDGDACVANTYIDELRVSQTARYTGSFTPSTSAFTNDADTLALLHFEEGANGTTEIFDDNGGTLPAPPSANYRTDSNSSSLVLVAPFDYLNEFADVHADIKGSGSNITPTVGSNASITTTQRKWTSSPDYQKGYEGIATSGQSQTQWALGTSIPSSNSGSNTFVIEGWFYANSATSNANWCISSADSGGRFLFSFNTGTTFQFGNENNIGIGSGWHHIAIVLDSGTKRFYYDGIYKGAWVSSNTGFSTLHLGQFNAGDTNDFRGHIQDFRVYVGTNNGYTGTNSSSANFTLPSSIIESYS